MQLSEEKPRNRRLVLSAVWAATALVLFGQVNFFRDYLALSGGLGLRGAPAASTPLTQTYPSFAIDSHMWVRHALTLLETPTAQLRYTSIDNAPYGREVHWNTAWAWTIAGAGWLYHKATGIPLPHAVEKATLWLAPGALFILIVALSAWASRRAGAMAGVTIAIAMVCHEQMAEGFVPSYIDHHGLLTVAAFGTILGAAFMGGGWWQEKRKGIGAILPPSPAAIKSAAVFSALCGAGGMWVSAASAMPPIAIAGLAGVLVLLLHGRHAARQGAIFEPEAWRIWGRAGAAASALFYLLEYFPGHLGLRLEANHPIYSLAWLGAGELIAQIGERWLGPREQRWRNWPRLLWPPLAIAAAPLTIALGGPAVFAVIDPFVYALHRDHIREFLPSWKTGQAFNFVQGLPLLAAVATLAFRRERPVLLWFAMYAVLAFEGMALWQSRWTLNASGGQVTLALVVLATWTTTARPLTRWTIAIVALAVAYLPTGLKRHSVAFVDLTRGTYIAPENAMPALYRDIARALRAAQPEGDIILLASPDASTGIGYYGRLKTLGTTYWENRDGLKAAAAILSAQTQAEAADLIARRKVTHVALVGAGNFVAEFHRLLHPAATSDAIRQSFGHRLLEPGGVPRWLQRIPYTVPEDLAYIGIPIVLFTVDFNRTDGDSAASDTRRITLAASSVVDEHASEEAQLDRQIAATPGAFHLYLHKAELLFSRASWAEAFDYMKQGIVRAPAAKRSEYYQAGAGAFQQQGQPAFAMQMYRAALAEGFEPLVASQLAWLLATSADDTLRNGGEALGLAQRAAAMNPDHPFSWSAVAAALGENGRFPEAIDAANRALTLARTSGTATMRQATEANLATLQVRRPIRN